AVVPSPAPRGTSAMPVFEFEVPSLTTTLTARSVVLGFCEVLLYVNVRKQAWYVDLLTEPLNARTPVVESYAVMVMPEQLPAVTDKSSDVLSGCVVSVGVAD